MARPTSPWSLIPWTSRPLSRQRWPCWVPACSAWLRCVVVRFRGNPHLLSRRELIKGRPFGAALFLWSTPLFRDALMRLAYHENRAILCDLLDTEESG